MNITQTFYDKLATQYDKLFLDWQATTHEQAVILDRIFGDHGFDSSARILDCACGIGTQSIGLAGLGYPVTASDISEGELAEGEEITVKGIVGPSLVNKVGFYLMGENGLIAVLTTSDVMSTLEIGHEVIIEAVRHNNTKGGTAYYGQTCLKDAVVLVNNQGNHDYNDDYFVSGKTLADLSALDVTVDYTTSVYVATATIEYVETAYYTSLKLTHNGTEFSLYMSGAGQYSWLSQFAGQEVTLEIAICNWNDKTYYRGCILSVITEDGKVYNTLNFDSN